MKSPVVGGASKRSARNPRNCLTSRLYAFFYKETPEEREQEAEPAAVVAQAAVEYPCQELWERPDRLQYICGPDQNPGKTCSR